MTRQVGARLVRFLPRALLGARRWWRVGRVLFLSSAATIIEYGLTTDVQPTAARCEDDNEIAADKGRNL